MKHSIAIAFALTLAIACGDSKPEPVTPTPPGPSDTPVETAPPPTTSAPPIASTPPAPSETAPPVATTPPPADTTPANKTTGNLPEAKDECTPVSIDFEKRARPKFKECYAEGKKKDANLQGTVKIKVTIDVKGKIKKTQITEKTLPDVVADCMLKAVKTTAFPEVEKCWDSTILLPITFPTPK